MNYEFSMIFFYLGKSKLFRLLEKTIGWKLSNNHYGMSIGTIIGSLLVLESNQSEDRKLLFRGMNIILNKILMFLNQGSVNH